MTQTQVKTGTPPTEPFKKKYKIQGMVVAVIMMWLDFILIYLGLNSGNSFLMATGMGVMVVAAAIICYFC